LDCLDYPTSEVEIIVVDDGSRAPLERQVVHAPPNTTFLRVPVSHGPADARNRGAAIARGTYLAFLDSDCLACPGWLGALERHLESGAIAGGRIANGNPDSLLASATMTILDAVYRHYNRSREDSRFLAAANVAVPASTFREMRGFDPEFLTSEDRDFSERCAQRGLRLVYVPDAFVTHDSPVGALRFWRRHYGYGRGAFRFRSSHLPRLEPGAFYWSMLTQAWRESPGERGVALGLLVLLSQVASALGYAAEWLRRRFTRGYTLTGRRV